MRRDPSPIYRCQGREDPCHDRARAILEVLTCGNGSCPCQAAARAGKGATHCPHHLDQTPSFSVTVSSGRLLVRCHAGCSQDAVIAALKARGLWTAAPRECDSYRESRRSKGTAVSTSGGTRPETTDQAADRRLAARKLWNASLPIMGTPAERYLVGRGLSGELPRSLRFLPRAKHCSGRWFPVMLAAVTRWPGDTPVAVHRTFLSADGLGKAEAAPAKMSLGPVAGGAIRLGPPGDILVIAEGIETALSVQFATAIPAWAAVSAPNMPALVLPALPLVTTVIIAADPDSTGIREAHKAARRWLAEGRDVRLANPVTGDFNDLLRAAS